MLFVLSRASFGARKTGSPFPHDALGAETLDDPGRGGDHQDQMTGSQTGMPLAGKTSAAGSGGFGTRFVIRA
jgi:hypothetical protein